LNPLHHLAAHRLVPFPHRCPASLYTALLERYPALRGEELEARVFRLIMRHLLYGTYHHGEETGERQLLFTRNMLRSWLGANYGDFRCATGAWIKRFSASVLPIRVIEYRYTEQRARCVQADIPPQLLALRDAGLPRTLDEPSAPMVDLADGVIPSRRQQKGALDDYEAALRAQVAQLDAGPSADVLQYLNAQSPTALRRVVRRNWPAVWKAANELPLGGRRDSVYRTLSALSERIVTIYAPGTRTARLHARGESLHLLPADLRSIALSGPGCFSLDLHAAHAGICARLWGIDRLRALLEAEKDIWELFYRDLRVGPDQKPAMKAALYGSFYGMGELLMYQTLTGGRKGPAWEITKAERFMAHPLIQEILTARARAHRQAIAHGFIVDAFGREIQVSPRKYPPHKAWAQVAQSWEYRIMAASLTLLQQEPDLHVLAWLHDGMVCKAGDTSKRARWEKQLRGAIDREAAQHGFATHVS
jgi:hypothetical protein